MVAVEQVSRLLLACVVLVAVPGPSVLFVVGRALAFGRRTALASVAGNCIGSYLAAACVAIGLGPALQQSALLFDIVRFVGAAYLIWLGIAAIRHSSAPGATISGQGGTERLRQAVRTGVVVGLTNPKVFIVFAAVVPQFVDRTTGHVTVQMLQLSLVPVLIGMVTDSAWGLLAGRARSWLAETPGRSSAVGRGGGLALVGLGVSVAVAGRDS